MSFSEDKTCDVTSQNMEQEDKVNVEETSVNLGYVKKELNEEELDFEEKQYKIALTFENVSGQSLTEQKSNRDSLIDFLDGDVIMKIETGTVKLEDVKEENKDLIRKTIEQSNCNKCGWNYQVYCLNCSSLSHILNNLTPNLNLEPVLNSTPTNVLEIREVSRRSAVFALKTLPKGIILGPFEGIAPIESTTGFQWKIKNQKFVNDENGNWMKYIESVANYGSKNLDVFQFDGILYFEASREIQAGEELLVYYGLEEKELVESDKQEEYYLVPVKKEEYPKVFACTLCCLGFRLEGCLLEHKSKCPQANDRGSIKDFEIMQCRCCKVWMERQEHLESHMVHCRENYNRMSSGYSEEVDRNDANVGEMEDGCGTRNGKRTYQRDISSRSKDRKDDLQFDTKDHQWFSGANRETCVKECTLAKESNKKQLQNDRSHLQKHLYKHRRIKSLKCDICMMKFSRKDSLFRHISNKHTDDGGVKDYKCLECFYQTNDKSDLQRHLNTHSGLKPFQCDICMAKFTQKGNLTTHIRNKHTDDEGVKDYKCLECSYQTNDKRNFQRHLNKHKGIKAFQCDICMMKFNEKSNLKKHIKNKHANGGRVKDHQCSECSYETNSKSHLQIHLNKHKGIKPFQCDICMKEFSQKGNLNTHIKNKHKDDGGGKD